MSTQAPSSAGGQGPGRMPAVEARSSIAVFGGPPDDGQRGGLAGEEVARLQREDERQRRHVGRQQRHVLAVIQIGVPGLADAGGEQQAEGEMAHRTSEGPEAKHILQARSTRPPRRLNAVCKRPAAHRGPPT
jgi:hypothetical protein